MAQTAPDATFIIHVQLAVIGVILVIGLFYIWRIVTNIEEKVVNILHLQSRQAASSSGPPPQCPVNRQPQQQPHQPSHFNDELHMDEIDATDVLMKTVFGDVFMMSAMGGGGAGPANGVKVTEIIEEEDNDEEDEEDEDEDDDDNHEEDTPSVVADSSKLSKTKLKTLNVQLLRELCSQRSLSTDGVKAELIQRILDNSATTQQ